jgi:hypothetical protein
MAWTSRQVVSTVATGAHVPQAHTSTVQTTNALETIAIALQTTQWLKAHRTGTMEIAAETI